MTPREVLANLQYNTIYKHDLPEKVLTKLIRQLHFVSVTNWPSDLTTKPNFELLTKLKDRLSAVLIQKNYDETLLINLKTLPVTQAFREIKKIYLFLEDHLKNGKKA